MHRNGWAIVTAILIGVVIGLGGFTFGYAKGYSYLTSDPNACANCHVMDQHFSAWLKSSHSAVAGCNDCHTPHDNVAAKYYVKAKNGFWHSFYFTTGGFTDPIGITPSNHSVVEDACRYCHEPMVESVDHAAAGDAAELLNCTHCHPHVGHFVR